MFNIDFPLLLKEISFAYPRKDKFERKNENASYGPKFGQRLRKCLKLVFCWYLLSLHRKLIRLSQHANFKSELRTSSRLPCRNIQEIVGYQKCHFPLTVLMNESVPRFLGRWKVHKVIYKSNARSPGTHTRENWYFASSGHVLLSFLFPAACIQNFNCITKKRRWI